jgi:hypothetical protein
MGTSTSTAPMTRGAARVSGSVRTGPPSSTSMPPSSSSNHNRTIARMIHHRQHHPISSADYFRALDAQLDVSAGSTAASLDKSHSHSLTSSLTHDELNMGFPLLHLTSPINLPHPSQPESNVTWSHTLFPHSQSAPAPHYQHSCFIYFLHEVLRWSRISYKMLEIAMCYIGAVRRQVCNILNEQAQTPVS